MLVLSIKTRDSTKTKVLSIKMSVNGKTSIHLYLFLMFFEKRSSYLKLQLVDLLLDVLRLLV